MHKQEVPSTPIESGAKRKLIICSDQQGAIDGHAPAFAATPRWDLIADGAVSLTM
jgi:hypothetical protein